MLKSIAAQTDVKPKQKIWVSTSTDLSIIMQCMLKIESTIKGKTATISSLLTVTTKNLPAPGHRN